MSWRRLPAPQRVLAFVADGWRPTVADEIDDETREVRVHWPPGSDHHIVRDASRYRFVDATPE